MGEQENVESPKNLVLSEMDLYSYTILTYVANIEDLYADLKIIQIIVQNNETYEDVVEHILSVRSKFHLD